MLALTGTASRLREDGRTPPLAGAWTHGDHPSSHPLWPQQVELERGMLRQGADKFRDRVIEAERRGQLTRLHPVRNLLTEWLPGVADAIRGWCRTMDTSRGPKPIALPYVKQLDRHVAALVATREVLDSLSLRSPKLVGVALRIGRLVEYEQRVRHWEATEPDLFYHYKKDMDRNKATVTHRRRVNINRFNHLLEHADEEGLDLTWSDWGTEVQFRVGVALLDCVIRQTGWFELKSDPDHTAFRKRGRANKAQIVVAPKEGMVNWLSRCLDDAELASPEYEPTVMPPKRWTGTRTGGYWTPYVRAPRLVRFKASQESQKERAADEYDAFDMPKVYDALHLLQETPYQINGRVLDVVLKAWAKDEEIGKLPKVGEKPLPVRTPRMVEHALAVRDAKSKGLTPPEPDKKTAAEILAWKKQATPIHRFNAKSMSRRRAASAAVLIAEKYRDYDAIYFPHMLDFRGRLYPVPNYLQPQGDDLSRGLLAFSEAVPITEDSGGAGWLAIHLASCWGNDKVSYEDRIEWVEDREDLWRRIAADPMGTRDEWASVADKPWQSLAAIFEWVAFLDYGFGYMSNLPVMVDGTCNGIQHLSALTLDEVSGAHVNLVPSDKPSDIYKHVALLLQETLERIEKAGGEEAEKATYWLDLCNRDIPRDLTKRQVMVLPYGGTRDAFFKYTREWLDKTDPLRVEDLSGEEETLAALEARTKRVAFMVTHMWDAVALTVRGGLRVMKWLQDCAKVVAVDNQPLYWVVPSGFVVRHFYGLDRQVRCAVMLDGETYTITRTEKTSKLSVKEQLQGIAPNFIHSLDASALVDCLNRCHASGIRSVVTVHDAYGTHAANMWPLSRHIRESFVATHEADPLGAFRSACHNVLVGHLVVSEGMDPLDATDKADEMLPGPLDKGDLDLPAVLLSDYFFA